MLDFQQMLLYQEALIMTHRDRAGDLSGQRAGQRARQRAGRREAAGGERHRHAEHGRLVAERDRLGRVGARTDAA